MRGNPTLIPHSAFYDLEVGLLRRAGGRVEQLLTVHLIRADCLLPLGRNQPICKDFCVGHWFAGKEIATAMANFVNSWPAGIALCLFLLPAIAAAKGIATALLLTTAFCALGFILFAALYRTPSQAGSAATVPPASWPHPPPIRAMVVAGSIWGLFNAALGMVFGFGTTLLVERGWGLAAAGSATSLVLWIVSISVPFGGVLADRFGGVLADRTGKHIEIMLIGFALFSVALLTATRTDAVIPAFVALGLVGGRSAGPIMSLPARVLTPPVRAVGSISRCSTRSSSPHPSSPVSSPPGSERRRPPSTSAP
jgi:hypothetical protein